MVVYHGSWHTNRTARDCRVQQIVVSDGQPVEARPFYWSTRLTGSAYGAVLSRIHDYGGVRGALKPGPVRRGWTNR